MSDPILTTHLPVDDTQERLNLADFYNPNVLVNLGPSHPAMHGTLRVMCRVNGEVIEESTCEIG
jgi:NADH:ubiquinone oxidoreductase subunit D